MQTPKKTLYVSDLDGTLLNGERVLSDFTVNTINSLVAQGMLFTYATARSLTTASEVTAGLLLNAPVIVYNGAFICESKSGRRLVSHLFSDEEKQEILLVLTSHGVYPRVYALFDEKERYSYSPDHLSPGTKAYLAKRQNDPRANPTDASALACGDAFCFSCIDDHAKLCSAYDILKDRYQTLLYRDPYTNDYWLEVLPNEATKANAALKLKELLGCGRLVSFGDEKNDLSLFSVSDACYAVDNADAEVKRRATAIIGQNARDGVAKWLLSEWGVSVFKE